MRITLIVNVIFCVLAISKSEKSHQNGTAISEKTKLQYQISHYDFFLDMYRVITGKGYNHFLYSPMSIWLILASIFEGTDATTREKLNQILSLPEDVKTRMEYYKIATSRYLADRHADIFSARTFVVDESVVLNETWEKFVTENSLVDIVRLPFKKNKESVLNFAKKELSLELPKLNLGGNSLLLDGVDYSGLWTEAFSDAVVEESPFFDQAGNRIGAVDLMRTRRRVRLGYSPELDLKYIELPIGKDQRYRIIFAIALDPQKFSLFLKYKATDVLKLFAGLEWTDKPLDIAIPRVKLSSTVDVRSLLDGAGLDALWRDGEVTSFISTPPAMPTTFLQRATLTLNNAGIEPAAIDIDLGRSPKILDLAQETSFVANRPFLFGLLDVQTSSCILASQYSEPTYVD